MRIGNTVLSNSLICKSNGKSRLLDLTKSKCIAFFAFSTICFRALRKLPDFEKITPRYLYVSLKVILCPAKVNEMFLFVRELNTIAFVLVRFTLSFQILQYS